MRLIVSATAVAAMASQFVATLALGSEPSAYDAMRLWGFSAALLVATHAASIAVVHRRRRTELGGTRTLIVGAGQVGRLTARGSRRARARPAARRLPRQGAARQRAPAAAPRARRELGPRAGRRRLRRRLRRDHVLERAARRPARAPGRVRPARRPSARRPAALRARSVARRGHARRRPAAARAAADEPEELPVRDQVRARPHRRALPRPAPVARPARGRARRGALARTTDPLPAGARGPGRPALRDAQVPHDAPADGRSAERRRVRPERDRAGSRAPTGGRGSARSCAGPRWTSWRSCSTS